jgi:hypothetical protein
MYEARAELLGDPRVLEAKRRSHAVTHARPDVSVACSTTRGVP